MSAQDWTAVIIFAPFAVTVAAFVISDRRARRGGAPRPPDRVDRLIAECRDSGPQNLAWPPGTTTPAQYMPPHADLRPDHERLPAATCPECTWWYHGQPVWWPCPAHNPDADDHIDQWERELSQ